MRAPFLAALNVTVALKHRRADILHYSVQFSNPEFGIADIKLWAGRQVDGENSGRATIVSGLAVASRRFFLQL